MDRDDAQPSFHIENMTRWCEEKSVQILKSIIAEAEYPEKAEPIESIENQIVEASSELFSKETQNALQDKSFQMLQIAQYLKTIRLSSSDDPAQVEEKSFILEQMEQIATQSGNILDVQKNCDDANKVILEKTLKLRELTEERRRLQDEDKARRSTIKDDEEIARLEEGIKDAENELRLISRVLTRLIIHSGSDWIQDQEVCELLTQLDTF